MRGLNRNPSRCDEVMQALGAPGAGVPASDVTAHLAECPECAAWAEKQAVLSRAWEATRPIEPSPAAWADVWAGVTARLDAKPQDVLAFRPNHRVRWMRTAQAAAVVAALVLGWVQFQRSTPHAPEAPAVVGSQPPAPLVVQSEIDISAGEIVMLRDDGHGLQPVVLASDDRYGVDPNFQMLNVFEAMAE
jgi:hypothetical protein